MLFVVWALMFISQVGVSAAAPDFQAMKISELRDFLSVRGETCTDCVEKSQFVKRAVEVQDHPPTVKADLKKEIFDEINDLRTNLGLDPIATDEVDEQMESARRKGKEEKEEKARKKANEDKKTSSSSSPSSSTSTKKKEEGKKGKPEEKKQKTATTKQEESKKNAKKTTTKKQAKAEEKEEEKDSKKGSQQTKEKEEKKKKDDKKKKEAEKDKKKEAEKDKKKEAEKDKKEAKTKTKEEAKKTTKTTDKDKKPEAQTKTKNEKKKTKEEKEESEEEETMKDKTTDKSKTTKATKDTKKSTKEKEKPKEKTQKDSGTIGAVWRTRGVKACEGILKEDTKSALALPDVCQIYGTAIFEVFEEFDKSMSGLSFLNSNTAGGLFGGKRGGLKATSLTQPFLAAGLKAVKVAATAVILEANKPAAKTTEVPLTTPTTCPEVMCSMFCEHGFVPDENGCDTCACKEELTVGGKKDEHGCALGGGYTWCEPKSKCLRVWEEPCEECPEVMCSMFCEHGFKKDDKGCDTCVCREAREPLGGKDEHGCAKGGGYTWCEAKNKCLRTWEEPCEATETNTTAETPAEEKSLAERIKEITRKETTTWLFEVAMKNPDKFKRQQEWDDILKNNKFGDGWDPSSSSPPSSSSSSGSWKPPPPRSGKVSEAETYFDSLFEEKEGPTEEAGKKADSKSPPTTLLRKGYNKRDSRSHVLEPEELEGVLDLDAPAAHDEI